MRRRIVRSAEASPASPAVDSLQRGLEALRCFRPGEDTLGIAELARRLELPRPTTLRLLKTLEAHGLLRCLQEDELFGLDVGCLLIGQAYLSRSVLVHKAQSVLQNLADQSGLDVVLCVSDRGQMLVLAHVAAKYASRLPLGVGLSLPVGPTAIGCAWLWSQRPIVQGEWIARLRADAGDHGGAYQVAKVYRAFHDIERDGVCTSIDGWRKGVAMIASSVFLRDGSTAVVGLVREGSGSDGSFFPPQFALALREAVAEIGLS